MKKLITALFTLILVPTAVFAANFHVDLPHIIDSPNFRYGQENTNVTIGDFMSARRQIDIQAKDFQAQLRQVTQTLQQQADENSKKLAATVEDNALPQLELQLRNKALASGDTLDIQSDSMMWKATYTRTAPSKATRTDVATVDYTTSKCRIVTKVAPYGIAVAGVSQFLKK